MFAVFVWSEQKYCEILFDVQVCVVIRGMHFGVLLFCVEKEANAKTTWDAASCRESALIYLLCPLFRVMLAATSDHGLVIDRSFMPCAVRSWFIYLCFDDESRMFQNGLVASRSITLRHPLPWRRCPTANPQLTRVSVLLAWNLTFVCVCAHGPRLRNSSMRTRSQISSCVTIFRHAEFVPFFCLSTFRVFSRTMLHFAPSRTATRLSFSRVSPPPALLTRDAALKWALPSNPWALSILVHFGDRVEVNVARTHNGVSSWGCLNPLLELIS